MRSGIAPLDSALPLRAFRLARLGQWLAWLGLIAGAVIVGRYCSSQTLFAAEVVQALGQIRMTMTDQAWHLGSLVLVALYGVFAWTMLEVSALFRALGQGNIFGGTVERGLQRLCYAALAGAIGGILGRTALTLIVTYANAPGQRRLVLEASSNDLISLLAAIFLFLFARIVAEARRMRSENEAFI